MKRISAEHLRVLRSEVGILAVICDLRIPTKFRGSRLTFRCPACRNFHTALNHEKNLARCFACQRNFNPIDVAMSETNCGFLDAVDYLKTIILSTSETD